MFGTRLHPLQSVRRWLSLAIGLLGVVGGVIGLAGDGPVLKWDVVLVVAGVATIGLSFLQGTRLLGRVLEPLLVVFLPINVLEGFLLAPLVVDSWLQPTVQSVCGGLYVTSLMSLFYQWAGFPGSARSVPEDAPVTLELVCFFGHCITFYSLFMVFYLSGEKDFQAMYAYPFGPLAITLLGLLMAGWGWREIRRRDRDEKGIS